MHEHYVLDFVVANPGKRAPFIAVALEVAADDVLIHLEAWRQEGYVREEAGRFYPAEPYDRDLELAAEIVQRLGQRP